MAIYKKRVSVGSFLKKGEDFKENDLLTVVGEGKQVEGQYGVQDIFMIKLSDGTEGNISFNSTSINNLIDAFGEDSKNWIGKKVKVWTIMSNVQGKMIKVYYFSHPDAVLTDEGAFELPIGVGSSDSTTDPGPVPDEDPLPPEDAD